MSRASTDHHQLQQLVGGLCEGVILAALDGHILWVNPAALVMHGVSEASALGGTAAAYAKRFTLTYRNNHDLAADQYPIARALNDGPFRDLVVDVSHAGADSPCSTQQIQALTLTDSDGEPDCIALLIEDITGQMTAEERFERAFKANPAPALICRLSDLRYLRVNAGFLDMTGFERAAIIDHSVYEIDVLADCDTRDDAIEKLEAGETIGQREAVLALPDNQHKSVIVAGQPIDMHGEAAMLFTFMDINPLRDAEDALRHSEERFARSFRVSPAPTLMLDRSDLSIIDANQSFTDVFGYAHHEVVGKCAAAVPLLGNDAMVQRLLTALDNDETVRAWELASPTRDKRMIDCLLSAEPMQVDDRPGVLVVLQDISERKRTETDLLNAIEAVMRDTSWFSRTVIEKLANIRSHGKTPILPGPELADLTAREQDVLALICRGIADKEIAVELKVSINTVRNHVSSIYSKLDVHKRGAAIVWARERGFAGYDAADSGK